MEYVSKNSASTLSSKLTKADVYKIATALIVIVCTMLFATLFLAFIILRKSMYAWPPLGTREVPLLYPYLSTLFIIFSSLFMAKVQHSFNLSKLGKSIFYLKLTLTFAFLFFISQVFFYKQLNSNQFHIDGNIFTSILYVLTIVHIAHFIIGGFALNYLKKKLVKILAGNIHIDGKQGFEPESFVKCVSLLWHFLAFIWFAIFLFLFVI